MGIMSRRRIAEGVKKKAAAQAQKKIEESKDFAKSTTPEVPPVVIADEPKMSDVVEPEVTDESEGKNKKEKKNGSNRNAKN